MSGRGARAGLCGGPYGGGAVQSCFFTTPQWGAEVYERSGAEGRGQGCVAERKRFEQTRAAGPGAAHLPSPSPQGPRRAHPASPGNSTAPLVRAVPVSCAQLYVRCVCG
jgi:hypothetical protein